MAIRKPRTDAMRAMAGSAKEQIDFVATYRPDLLASTVSETSAGLYMSRRALKAAVIETYAHLCRTSPKAMGRGRG